MLGGGCEQIIGDIDLVEIKRMEMGQFVDHLERVAVADLGAHHLPAHTENTAKRTAPAGGHADWQPQGPVPTQGDEVARRLW